MLATELKRAWPDHWATRDVSDSELERIAAAAENVEDADRIWRDDDSWTDWTSELNSRIDALQARRANPDPDLEEDAAGLARDLIVADRAGEIVGAVYCDDQPLDLLPPDIRRAIIETGH